MSGVRCGSGCSDGYGVDSSRRDGLIVNVTDLNMLRNCRGYAVDMYTNMVFSWFDTNGSPKVRCFYNNMLLLSLLLKHAFLGV